MKWRVHKSIPHEAYPRSRRAKVRLIVHKWRPMATAGTHILQELSHVSAKSQSNWQPEQSADRTAAQKPRKVLVVCPGFRNERA